MTRGREVSFITPGKRPFKTIFQFKITLSDTEPPVWRRIQVPGYYTFYDLHVAIQNAMGWTDSHLHVYEIGKKRLIRIESPYALDDLFEEAKYFTPNTQLSRFFSKEHDSAVYEYDFGDGWRHEVLLEDIMLRKSGVKYPACLDGQLACPPEDCGGVDGYMECVDMAEGRHPFKDDADARQLKVWLGDWRPEKFNAKEVVFENPRTRFLRTMRPD
jgi:hypothetical protein